MSEHSHDTEPVYDEGFWNERYRCSPHVWSGNPNPQLVAEIANLAPGRALDVGCGEGADTIWLARRGWDVVPTDISQRRPRARCPARPRLRSRGLSRHRVAAGRPPGPPARARLLLPRLGAVHAHAGGASHTTLHRSRRVCPGRRNAARGRRGGSWGGRDQRVDGGGPDTDAVPQHLAAGGIGSGLAKSGRGHVQVQRGRHPRAGRDRRAGGRRRLRPGRWPPRGAFTPNEDAAHEAQESPDREAAEDARKSQATPAPATPTPTPSPTN